MNRLLMGIAGIISVAVLLLMLPRQNFSRIDAGGPRLRMLISGVGRSVVFEAGGGGSLELWGRVPAEVSRFAKTIAYDRAGSGLSEKATSLRDGRHIATELHTALHNANVSKPFVLVGHSLGGPYIRIFADMYPDEVAGMVLVDPTQDELFVPRRSRCTSESEPDCDAVTFAQVRESQVPANVPVFLIHAGGPDVTPFWSKALKAIQQERAAFAPRKLNAHRKWVETIPGGRFINAENSSHLIPLNDPDLVVRTIREAVVQSKAIARQR